MYLGPGNRSNLPMRYAVIDDRTSEYIGDDLTHAEATALRISHHHRIVRVS